MGCSNNKPSKKSVLVSEPTSRRLSFEISDKSVNSEHLATRKLLKRRTPVADPRIHYLDKNSEIDSTFLIERPQTLREKTDILKALSSHFIFNSLSIENMRELATQFKFYSVSANFTVFTQGSPGKNFFIVASGSVDVIVDGEVKTTIFKGGQFGELALLHDSLRTATITTIEKSAFWVLSREAFKSAVKAVSESKQGENKNFIDNIPIFSVLTESQKEFLLTFLVTHEFNPGQKIVRENDPGDIFYIIKKGTVVCSLNGLEIRKLHAGNFFGEQGLLYESKRAATVIALDKVSALSLRSEDLVKVLGTQLQSIIYKNIKRIAVEQSKLLKLLTKEQIDAIVELMSVYSFEAGKTVIKKNSTKGKNLVFVLKGEISNQTESIKVFDCLGDSDLVAEPGVYSEKFVAVCDTDVAVLKRSTLEKTIGGDLLSVINTNEFLRILKRVQILRGLPLAKLESLISVFELQEYPASFIIFEQGDIGDAFYIIKSGQVEIIIDGNPVRVIDRHDFFGERAILFNEKRTATVVSKNAVCWVLSKENFLNIIDKFIRKQIMKRIDLQNDSVMLKDLVLVKLLGKGMFGNVFLAHNPKTKMSYALKTVHRSIIKECNIFKNLCLERRILMQIDHPFVVKLVKTFKDSDRIYFLMELVQGIDLFDVMRQVDQINESIAAFYIACLALIFEHLHERNIIYRDLKPENVMVDEEGYTKLIDFGTANIINERTYTVVGTAHYMAPEVIKGTGYGLEADYWSLGVILYELVMNSVPFGEGETDPYKIYSLVLESKLQLPPNANIQCKGLIEKLLNKNPALRGNIESLKKNEWFIGIDWDQLLSKQVKPPFIPKVSRHKRDIAKTLTSEHNFQGIIKDQESSKIASSTSLKSQSQNSVWDNEF